MRFIVLSLSVIFSIIACGILPFNGFSQTETLKTKDTDSVYFRLKNGLQLAEKENNHLLIARRLIEFGDFYRQNEAINQALINYQRAADYLPDGDTALVYIQLQSGRIQFRLKEYKSALDYFTRGLELSQRIGYHRGQAMCTGYIGSCFEKLGGYNKAIAYQNKSLEVFKQLGDGSGLAMTYENLGSIYEDLGRFDLALNYFKKAQIHVNPQFDENPHINILNNIADVYRKTGVLDHALKQSRKALLLAIEAGNEHQMESAYKDISKTFYELEAYQEAFLNLKLSDSINEVILQDQNRKQLAALQTLYDAKTKNSKIELLLKENEISNIQNRVMWLGMLLLLTIAGGSYWHQRNIKKQQLKIAQYKHKILEAELQNKRMEQQSLEREITLKTASLSNYSLHLARKNKTLTNVAQTLTNIKGRNRLDVDQKLTQLADEITIEASEKREWNQFMEYFGQIHPDFFKKLREVSISDLSVAELRLCMLLKLNMSSKEIAAVLKITPDSIRVARYRLRKKLLIQKGQELSGFLQQLT